MNLDSLDLIKVLKILKRRYLVIILTCVFCFVLAFGYSFIFAPKVYSADVLLYIWQKQSTSVNGDNSSDYQDMLLFSQLVNDYQVLIKSRLVVSTVASELGLDEKQSAGLASQITVGSKNNTRHLTITVTDTNPDQAALIANTVADVFARVVVDNMGAGQVNIIDEALAPAVPSSPNKTQNVALGLLIGLVLGILLAVLIEMLDARVRTSSDVEAITGFRSLGVIPEYNQKQEEQEGSI